MILTSRFGALAARRTFPHVDEMEQESILDLRSAQVESELEAETADVEAAA